MKKEDSGVREVLTALEKIVREKFGETLFNLDENTEEEIPGLLGSKEYHIEEVEKCLMKRNTK